METKTMSIPPRVIALGLLALVLILMLTGCIGPSGDRRHRQRTQSIGAIRFIN